jgi:superfamily II DNA or RNA helicase/tRNA1(Val) A37 N6-methylase TrmN6
MQTKLTSYLQKLAKSGSDEVIAESSDPIIPHLETSLPTKVDLAPESFTEQNELALQLIEKPEFSRGEVNELFNGLGVTYVNEEGMAGIYKKRMATLQQYFTPSAISELIVKVLNIPDQATILDNTCGSGRMFFHLPNKKLITGIEYEENAYKIVKALYPQACIIQDDAIYHIFHNNFDYVLINPPFNIQWYAPNLENVGYKGAILSHIACLEIATKAVKPGGYVVAILPANTFQLDSTIRFHSWLMKQMQEVIRIELPKTIFLRANYPSTIFIFRKVASDCFNKVKECVLPALDKLQDLVADLIKWEGYSDIQKYAESRTSVSPIVITPFEKSKVKRPERTYELMNSDSVIVDHNGNSLSLTPNGLVAQLKIQNIFARYNQHKWDPSLKTYVSETSQLKSLNKIWGQDSSTVLDHTILNQLNQLNVKLTVKPALPIYVEKKRRWLKQQQVPMEQWVKATETAEWTEVYTGEGTRKTLEHDYNLQKQRLISLATRFPFVNDLYEFQKDDIVRASLKDSIIDCSQMGLGKTRKAITLALLRQSKRVLIVLPTRLIHTWEKEFQKLNEGQPKTDPLKYKIIEKESDCKRLEQFSIISYHTLSLKSWYRNPNLNFADKLKRRFKMIIADEAHAFSKKVSKRTLALRRLKAKYWLFLTGTPINNTVKNLWSICDILFKAGTPRFPYSTSEFRKEFVTVEMVTREFDDTLCKGKTSQQLPKIKNLPEFLDLVKPMWIRRLKEEPKVCENVKIVKPDIEVRELVADEEHWRVYKQHLDHFAELFIQYLHPELHEHDRVKAAVVLAQLGNLQFVSTIPQHAKFDIFEKPFQYKRSLTVIQTEVLQAVQQYYKTEKILVISQRPDFCTFMQTQLKQQGIASGVFTGQVDIEKRNQSLDRFESEDNFNVLLCSINVIKEGINIPTGTMVLMVDLDWTYQKLEQAYSRVLRPETRKSPKVVLLYYKGFIDQYLWQHIRAKKSAVLEGIDHRTDVENVEWVHWKQFTIDMLKDLGYNLD